MELLLRLHTLINVCFPIYRRFYIYRDIVFLIGFMIQESVFLCVTTKTAGGNSSMLVAINGIIQN